MEFIPMSSSTESAPSDDKITKRLSELLNSNDMKVLSMTPKQLREKLSVEFGYNLSPKKEFFKDTINQLIENLNNSPLEKAENTKKSKPVAVKKPIAKKADAKTLHISPALVSFCKDANPTLGDKMNMSDVRSCITQYVKDKDLKDPKAPRQFIIDDKLCEIFPNAARTKKVVKFFDIYKVLKSEKMYSYWM